MNEIKVGDKVRLKSGGPTMTVHIASLYLRESCTVCVWFEGNKRQEGEFDIAALEIVDEDS